MNAIKILIITIALLAHSQVSFAQVTFDNGNQLREYCKQAIHGFDETFDVDTISVLKLQQAAACFGFVVAISKFNYTLPTLKMDKVFCPDKSVTWGMMTRVVAKYLEDNPNVLHYDPGSLAIEALIRAYPCK